MINIAAGANHLVALTDKSKIFSWGSGEKGQLGRKILERHNKNGLIPQCVNLIRGSRYERVVCGSYHTLAVDDQQRVFSFGLNNYGQLGLGDHEERMNLDLIGSLEDKKIVDMGAGEHHSIVLTDKGEVYGFGRGDSGQLGVADQENTADPIQISTLSNVSLIATGGNHNLAYSNGQIFAWGYGEMFQLGTGKDEDEATPAPVSFKGTVLQLQAGGQHSIILAQK